MLANLSMAVVLETAAVVSGVLQKLQPLITYGPWLCRILPVSHSEWWTSIPAVYVSKSS